MFYRRKICSFAAFQVLVFSTKFLLQTFSILSILQGPNRKQLKAIRENYESFDFQDELGQVVLQVCQTVPFGILCFLPSYDKVEQLYSRWTATKLMQKLSVHKRVFKEPRFGSDLDETLTAYYQAVVNPFEFGDHCTGAILMAVYRGI